MESTPQLTAVEPARPVAAYVGGKRSLAGRLTALIATVPHATYAEVFVGMGGVFLRRKVRPGSEVINDWSQDVWTLFRVLQVHYQAFLDHMRFQVTARAEFERLARTDPSTLTDIQRAARFLYLQRVAFGGKVVGRNFAMEPGRPARFDLTRLEQMLADLYERLKGVVIERLHFAEFIRRYDRPDTLFYLDPPYFGSEGHYGEELFSREDFEQLRDSLAAAKGRWILSINDTPEIRALFAAFTIEPATLTYRLSGAPTEAKELIIHNLKAG